MKFRSMSLSRMVFLCFLTTIIVVELTFAKYATTFSMENKSKVAVMASDVEFNIMTPESLYPGSEAAVVQLVFTNEENGQVCDISQNYSFSIERDSTINLPLEFSVYKDEDCSELFEPDDNGIYQDQSQTFKAGVSSNNIYYLKINWPEEYNDASYAFEVDYFKVLVNVEQID